MIQMVLKLSRHIASSGKMHLKAAKRVFRFLKVTVKLGLCYTETGEYTLQCYIYASYGGDEEDRHSTIGCATMISQIQKHIASEEQPADLLTKKLGVAMSRKLMEFILGIQ